MSYAIIRNTNYKKDNLSFIYRHNERKNTNYSNLEIDKEKSKKNYSIKNPQTTYWKALSNLIEKYDIKGRIIKSTNILCEFIITSDKDFFESIGEEETKRFFYTAYKFVASYQNLGEEFIISAKVHMDESTPHMHLVFCPVMHKTDEKSGKTINKMACSEYWKGKFSYKKLQDHFYKYMTRAGFELERGLSKGNEHVPIDKLKVITNYEMQELLKDSDQQEKEIITNNIEEMRVDYKRIIKKFNTLAKQYTRVKTITDTLVYKQEQIQKENNELKDEVYKLQEENDNLNHFLEKTYEYVSILFNFPIDSLKRLVKGFVDKMKGE